MAVTAVKMNRLDGGGAESITIAAEAIGERGDLEWAASFLANAVSDRVLHAAVRAGQRNVNATKNNFWKQFVLPCSWPQLVLCFPCISSTLQNQVVALEARVVVVTDQEVVIITQDHTHVNFLCCSHTTGTDSQTVPLSQVSSVTVDQAGRGTWMQQIPAVHLTVVGAASNTSFICAEPERVRRVINDLKDGTAGTAGGSGGAGKGARRVFVALSTAPAGMKIFQFGNKPLPALCSQVEAGFGTPGVIGLSLILPSGEACAVEDSTDIRDSDRLIAIVG